jgi:predicted DNA-binding protein
MKKTYSMTLDEEKVDALKIWLDKNGQTFSGYINSMIGETLQALDDFSVGDTEKVSFFTLLSMAGKMTKSLKRELKK